MDCRWPGDSWPHAPEAERETRRYTFNVALKESWKDYVRRLEVFPLDTWEIHGPHAAAAESKTRRYKTLKESWKVHVTPSLHGLPSSYIWKNRGRVCHHSVVGAEDRTGWLRSRVYKSANVPSLTRTCVPSCGSASTRGAAGDKRNLTASRSFSPSVWYHPMDDCLLLEEAWKLYSERMKKYMPRVNMFMMFAGVLTAFVVAVVSLAPRYRRHPVMGILFLAASTLFLPIISLVSGAMGEDHLFPPAIKQAAEDCTMSSHILLVLIWTGLVLDISISTSTDIPNSLLMKSVWFAYLVTSNISFRVTLTSTKYIWSNRYITIDVLIIVVLFTKLAFKYFKLYKTRMSLALGRSPRFIAGYMAQLQPAPQPDHERQVPDTVHPPPLILSGEDDLEVVEMPDGYRTSTPGRLITIDRVWSQAEGITTITPDPKHLCLSFALFKLLHCRFSGYSVSESGIMKAHPFIRHHYLRGSDYTRVFDLIKNELMFFHDLKFSSIPITFSNSLLAATSILLSLSTIFYSLYLSVLIKAAVRRSRGFVEICVCSHSREQFHDSKGISITRADVIPVIMVLAVLLFSETIMILSYVFSNWTKISVFCIYTKRVSWQSVPAFRRLIKFIFKNCSSNKLKTIWDERMGQCSVLVHHPGRPSKFSVGLTRARRFLVMPDQKVKIGNEIKHVVYMSLQRLVTSNQTHMVPRPISPMDGSSSILEGQPKAEAILSWHVATSLLEVSQPQPSDSMAAACQLSRYVAYLVCCHPELVTVEDQKWCQKLFKEAKRNADQAVATAGPGVSYPRLSDALNAEPHHAVLKEGVKLAGLLVSTEVTWEVMANFWSDMLLYVAPCDNLQAQAAAIERGGELVTLLWALLGHTGFSSST